MVKWMSLPSRERGLKLVTEDQTYFTSRSLPSRERGLKFKDKYRQYKFSTVAPLAGAWIEIQP